MEDRANKFIGEVAAEVVRQLTEGDFAAHVAEKAAAIAIQRMGQAPTQNGANHQGLDGALEEARSHLALTDGGSNGGSGLDYHTAIQAQVAQFVANPVGYITPLIDLWQKVKTTAPQPGQKLSLAQIDAIATANPDEFDYVHGKRFPDLMSEVIPQLTAEAYRQGARSTVEANRWVREYLKNLALAEKHLPDSSVSGIPIESSTVAIASSKPTKGKSSAGKRAVLLNQNPVKSLRELL